MAEGGRLVHQGLDRGWEPDCVAITAEGLTRSHIRDLAERLTATDARIIEVPERILTQITGKDNPGAIAAAFQQRRRQLDDLASAQIGRWLALYEIRDPGNLGTILRTADCAAISGVVLLGKCCDPYSIEAVRASMGAVFDVPFATADFDTFNAWRTANSAKLVAATVNGSLRHDRVDYGKRVAIIMGNEQSGLPEDVEKSCDQLTLIPMRPGSDSLNLAQAAALMTYEAWRSQGYPGA